MGSLADMVLKTGVVVSASGLLVAFAGRLAEDTSGNPYDNYIIAGGSLAAFGTTAIVIGMIVNDQRSRREEDLENKRHYKEHIHPHQKNSQRHY
ncbi:hypothetical protein J4463_00735 [Candidatus Pacearchaeota archaeon]|nr:hypothetical protein [Candidatus Pacearchaeota archaeon]